MWKWKLIGSLVASMSGFNIPRCFISTCSAGCFGATTIADIYKQRWQIELFFKALKQNLRVKSFVGTSENALRIQIWTALIALLLLKWLHHLSKARWSLSNLASMLRLNLFTYRDLRDWIDDPFNTPPLQPVPEQLELALS